MTTIDRDGIMMAPPYFSPLRLGAASIAGLSVIITGGWIAVAVGAFLAVIIPFVSPPYWFTLSQVAAIGLVGEAGGILPLLIVEGGLLFSFVLSSVSVTDRQTGSVLLVVSGLCLAVCWGVYSILESLTSVVAITGTLLAITLYLLYRYELLQLGIIRAEA